MICHANEKCLASKQNKTKQNDNDNYLEQYKSYTNIYHPNR